MPCCGGNHAKDGSLDILLRGRGQQRSKKESVRTKLPRLGLLLLLPGLSWVHAEDPLRPLEELATVDPTPFVIVESSVKQTTSRAQGVVISPAGHVLSVGHITWVDKEESFSDKFRISFRGTGKGLPEKADHVHSLSFLDREGEKFFEHYYPGKLLWQGKTRFVDGGDLAVFKIPGTKGYPVMDFFSKTKPTLSAGETLHLCHYINPFKPADPNFLMSPLKVVGVAKTPHGLQYLAEGYYRIGSSGGAILKEGKLIGIQSSAYTINGKQPGESPYGMISFELVWKDRIASALPSPVEKEKGK